MIENKVKDFEMIIREQITPKGDGNFSFLFNIFTISLY